MATKVVTGHAVLLILLAVGIALTSLAVYWLLMPSPIGIVDARFAIDEAGRRIVITVRAEAGSGATLDGVYVNSSTPLWTSGRRHLNPGDVENVTIDHYWLSERSYTIRVTTRQGASARGLFTAPGIAIRPSVDITRLRGEPWEGLSRLHVSLRVNATGLSWCRAFVFASRAFDDKALPVYVFYDPRYLADEALRRTERLIELAQGCGINVSRVDWGGLEALARRRPRAVLVLTSPMVGASGRRYYNAVPSPLLDPDEDGLIREHSRYRKSIVYDWERDDGLVLITTSSFQSMGFNESLLRELGYTNSIPHEWVMAKNGSAYASAEALYVDRLYTNGMGMAGYGRRMTLPITRIAETLGLHPWSSWWHARIDFLRSTPSPFYVYCRGYGDIPQADMRSYANPVFVRVGEGGFLYCGDGLNLGDELFAHDLLLLMLHEPWNAVPLHGDSWDFDSGFVPLSPNGGISDTTVTVRTDWLVCPPEYYVRALLLGFDADAGRYAVASKTVHYMAHPSPSFEIVRIEAPGGASWGETVSVAVYVKNTGNVTASVRVGLQTVGLETGSLGDKIFSPYQVLDPGQTGAFSIQHAMWSELIEDSIWVESDKTAFLRTGVVVRPLE